MADIRTKEQPHVTAFSQRKIEEDKWYFAELYHLNNESAKSLVNSPTDTLARHYT